MEYCLHLFILIALYTFLAHTLNLSAGLPGLISLAHAGFFGIGAYTTAILSTKYGLPFLLNLPVAVILSSLTAFIVSFIALRTVDDYFVICTIGIQVVLYSLMYNSRSITEGPLGIPGIPVITIFGIGLNSRLSFLILAVIALGINWWLLRNLFRSGFGKTLVAISQDEVFAQSIGKNVHHAKVTSFTLSAALAAIPGTLYAHFITFVYPGNFTVNESIFILSIVIIGGLGSLSGTLVAATALVVLPELLRFTGISNAYAANIQQIIYGCLLILMMVFRKSGWTKRRHREIASHNGR
jgi:branched-chain amino acid transport system permease protein